AANALALAHLCRPFHCVICQRQAHIDTDECGAPEFFSGGTKLIPTTGVHGKLDLAEIESAVTQQIDRALHGSNPRVISITQSTELGTVYRRDEIERITGFARKHSLAVHMDGSRFANAVAALGCAPKTITWMAGIDVLCFGGTKNGIGA